MLKTSDVRIARLLGSRAKKSGASVKHIFGDITACKKKSASPIITSRGAEVASQASRLFAGRALAAGECQAALDQRLRATYGQRVT
jgi:hypothetical protein